MATPIPYRWIKGLDPDAQREIERNFLSLQSQVVAAGSPTLFDAVIDGSRTTDSPSTHTYKNIAGVIANETGWTAARNFSIAVIYSTVTPTSDSGTLIFPGSATFTGVGDISTGWHAGAWSTGVAQSPLDIRGTIQCEFGRVTFKNIMIFRNDGGASNLFSANSNAWFIDCFVSGNATGGTHSLSMGLASGMVVAQDTRFHDINPFSGGDTSYFFNCDFDWGTLAAITIGNGCVWIGGVWGQTAPGGGCTLTLGGAKNVVMVGLTNNVQNTTDTSRAVLNCSTTGSVYIQAVNVFADVTVANGSGHVWLDLDLISALTVGTNTVPSSVRNFNVSIKHVANPDINLVGCTDAFIQAQLFGTAAVGAKAYALDAASNRNKLLLSGNANPNYTVASTDLGAGNVIL